MDTDKKAFITFLIIAGLFSGYWIFGGVFSYVSDYFSDNNSTYSFETGSNTENSFIENPNQEIENITNKIALNISDKFMSGGDITEEDLTSSSTKNLLEKIDFNNINDPSEISENISPDDFGIIYNIDTSEINIILDTPSNVKKYWDNYGLIISNIMPGIEDTDSINKFLNSILNGDDISEINNIIIDSQDVYNELSKINVPQSLINFHSDNMIFFKNLSSVMSSVVKYKEDPLRAYVLIEYFPNLMDRWSNIRDFINRYTSKN